MRARRVVWFVGALWLVLFLMLALMTPSHYVQVAQTAPGVTHVVSTGDVNGGPLGALAASALRALVITGFISILIVLIGATITGFRPFLTRIGVLSPRDSDEYL